jgi:hypothetical protein
MDIAAASASTVATRFLLSLERFRRSCDHFMNRPHALRQRCWPGLQNDVRRNCVHMPVAHGADLIPSLAPANLLSTHFSSAPRCQNHLRSAPCHFGRIDHAVSCFAATFQLGKDRFVPGDLDQFFHPLDAAD